MSSERFSGRTVVVTGAGSGIGKATALRLVAEGAVVVANDVVAGRLDELVGEVAEGAVRPVAGDVCDAATIDAILAAAGGSLDGLANVAGIMDSFQPAGEVDDEMWDRVMRVNVTGPLRLIRATLPLLLASGHGAIVNVTSEAALRGSAAGVAYTTSKHALVGVTRSTAYMYGPQGLRTNAVAPGPVATNIQAQIGSELGAGRVFPLLQSLGLATAQADQLAAAITWLLSDDSANVNGAILPSDGGWSVA